MGFYVNNNYWRIEYVKPNSKYLVRYDGSRTIGMTDPNTRTVYISYGLTYYLENRVLVHELTHVYCYEYGVYLPEETEEVVADFVATYASDILCTASKIKRLPHSMLR